jgi:hypothetical protein
LTQRHGFEKGFFTARQYFFDDFANAFRSIPMKNSARENTLLHAKKKASIACV